MAPSLPGKQPHWRPDIEGLRGLAVLLVVGFHAGFPLLRGAFVAVDVFFVLSGFFLTSALLRELVADRTVSLSDVYGRRVWRLMPALIVVLGATLLMSTFLFAPIDRADVASNLRPVAFFTGNLVFASEGVNYFTAGENPLLHLWTLGVEYQLLLFWPAFLVLLAWIARRRARGSESSGASSSARRMIIVQTLLVGIATAGAVSFALSLWLSTAAPMWAYFGPHTRLWAFAAGGAMAFIAGAGQSVFGASVRAITMAQIAGLLAIIVPAFLYSRTMPYPGVIALVPVGGTMLLLAGGALSSSTRFGRALASPLLTGLGRLSYAWYLWHWPLMVLGSVFAPTIGPWGRLAWGGVALLLAIITRHTIERPFERRVTPLFNRNDFGDPFTWAIGVSSALLLAASWAETRATRYVERSVHRKFAAAREDRMQHSCWARKAARNPKADCSFGDRSSSTTLVLLGDSHAEHWLGGLDRAGREHGWRVEARVMGGCPVSDFSRLTSGATRRRYRECSQYRERMLQRVIEERPRAVILSSYDYYVPATDADVDEYLVSVEAWQEGLRRTYARLSAAGIPVIVMRGTPQVPFDVPSCLSRRAERLLFATDCTYERDRDFTVRARQAQDAAARGLPVRFVDMNDQVCATRRCATTRRGIVMFTDDNHLTASFTRSLAPVLGARVERALQQEPILAVRTAADAAVR
ncbi:MAG: acyltransferase family protein [Gemmatimonadota bacterium]